MAARRNGVSLTATRKRLHRRCAKRLAKVTSDAKQSPRGMCRAPPEVA